MTIILAAILCIILSDLAFLAGYLLTFTACCAMDIPLAALVRRKLMTQSIIVGFLCGGMGSFCALCIAYVISRESGVNGVWLLILGMILPAMGLFLYFEKMVKQVAAEYTHTVSFYGRLHAAMMCIPQRQQFTLEKLLLEKQFPEDIGMAGDPLGKAAYKQAQKYQLRMTLFSFFGAILGLYLAFELMH